MQARATTLIGKFGVNVKHRRVQIRVDLIDRINIMKKGEHRYVIDVEYEDTGHAIFEFRSESGARQCFAALTGIAYPY